MKKIDLNLFPKEFCDTAHTAFNQYMMFFAFSSGDKVSAFATTPIQFKLILKLFNENLSAYEKQYGKIDLNKLKYISPIQLDDLSSTNE